MTSHTFFVVSKSDDVLIDGDGYHEPRLYGTAVEVVHAPNSREALRLAVTEARDPFVRGYIRDLRSEGRNPFGAFRVQHPSCEHEDCWCGLPDRLCAACVGAS